MQTQVIDYTPWLNYLNNLSVIELREAAKGFWAKLILIEGIGEVPVPAAMLSEDNDRLFICWDRGDHHIDLDK